ncbi:recombination protein NinG [Ornithobacterium rhinotracheale]|uniref:recombination protein NinG n=1 Tax=Ornithobacterium rhinotracheale TaxID=28251 RepID=UPI001FF0FA3B|nr:recombination protein NinG [Ornithobacterium rhinotracheale]MCK0201346.1 recombination protein NinG [Ornithobacterium rhinotracheale]
MGVKKCKVCKRNFVQKYGSLQVVCSYQCAIKLQKRKQRENDKRRRDALKTHGQWLKELQKVFNAYIRERDKDKPCISCGKAPHLGKRDAGHYYSVGARADIRFNEDNVHAQCVTCNQHKHGNLIEYRKGLIQRIGEERVNALDTERKNSKMTIYEIKQMIELYKKKRNDLRKNKTHNSD